MSDIGISALLKKTCIYCAPRKLCFYLVRAVVLLDKSGAFAW